MEEAVTENDKSLFSSPFVAVPSSVYVVPVIVPLLINKLLINRESVCSHILFFVQTSRSDARCFKRLLTNGFPV